VRIVVTPASTCGGAAGAENAAQRRRMLGIIHEGISSSVEAGAVEKSRPRLRGVTLVLEGIDFVDVDVDLEGVSRLMAEAFTGLEVADALLVGPLRGLFTSSTRSRCA
jgi:hypothetical protein